MKVKVPFGFDSVGYIEVEASDREDALVVCPVCIK
jgi:hypothetical protein